VTGGGLGTVTLTSDEVINVNTARGAVTVTGVAGQPDSLAVTPTGAQLGPGPGQRAGSES